LELAAYALNLSGVEIPLHKFELLKQWLNLGDNAHPWGTKSANHRDRKAEIATLKHAQKYAHIIAGIVPGMVPMLQLSPLQATHIFTAWKRIVENRELLEYISPKLYMIMERITGAIARPLVNSMDRA